MHDTYPDDDGAHLTPEQNYASFGHYQTCLADALEAGVFMENRQAAEDQLRHAYRTYSYDVTKRSYVEPEDEEPVINYVADKIDAATFDAGAEIESTEDELRVYRTAYERYARLANYEGIPMSGNNLLRTFFTMRDMYRRAATAAHELNDGAMVYRLNHYWSTYSKDLEKEVREYDPDYYERQGVYDEFLLDKQDPEAWYDVVHFAGHEDKRGEAPRAGLKDISTDELSDLANMLLGQTKDEQFATLTTRASNGETWANVLDQFGDAPFARAVKRFLSVVVTPEEVAAGKKERPAHAVIIGGRDIKSIDQLVFSNDRHVKGGVLPAQPIAEAVTVVEPITAVRMADQQALLDEPQVSFVDGLPTNMPFEAHSQELIIGTRNTENMDSRTLCDFYLELAHVLKHGGIYIESKEPRQTEDRIFYNWKLLLSQMIVDLVEDHTEILDKLDPGKEAALLEGLGLTEQTFKYDKREIRALVKEGAVKELGWYALQNSGGVNKVFTIEVGGKPDTPRTPQTRQTTRNTAIW